MIAPVFGVSHGKARHMISRQLLSIRQAAELTGLRRKIIRDRVTRGDVAVRVIGRGRGAKLRLTEDALVDAGLPGGKPVPAAKIDELAELVRLVREQQARLNALENQRFQLAGQLGTALERTLALQNQLLELTASVQARSPILTEPKRIEPTLLPADAEPVAVSPHGAKDAETTSDQPPARPTVAVRQVVDRLATSRGALRGKAGIARLRTMQWRSSK
jgi:hypothetical protein